MNKIKFIFILIVTSVITGCTLKKDKEFQPIDESGYTLIHADFKALNFSDEENVWKGEAIGVFGSEMGYNESYAIKNAYVGTSKAAFYGPMVKGDIAAYYPYDPSFIGDAHAMPFTLASDQSYLKESDNEGTEEFEDAVSLFRKYNPTAFAHMRNGKMDFYYPTGLLSLTLAFPEPMTVKTLRISSQSEGLSGLGVVMGDSSSKMTEGANKYITLDCGEGLVSKDENGELTEFYVVMVPGTYDDLQVSVFFENNDSPFVCNLPEVVIEKINSSDSQMQLTTVSIDMPDNDGNGPDGFEEVEEEFEE